MTTSNFPSLLRICLFLLLACCWLTAISAQAQKGREATALSYIARGNEWYSKGEYARAEADFTLAIATDPNQANAYYNRGITCHQLGKLNEALADFDRALKLNPSSNSRLRAKSL